MTDKMEVHIVTHGTHIKGGDTRETYDGSLEDEGRSLAWIITTYLSMHHFPVVFSGVMKRHRETCSALHLDEEKIRFCPICGDDVVMFRVIEGDEDPVDDFWEWLTSLKSEHHKVLLIVSRLQAYIIAYKIGGGREKFGPFMNFVETIEAAAKWGGTIIPLTRSGQPHHFRI